MTFSLRSLLIVIAMIALWLSALFSKSPWMIDAATTITMLFIALALAFSIWDGRRRRRAFWTGLFIVGLGNFLLADYLSAYQRTSFQIADAILGTSPSPRPLPYFPSYVPPPPSALMQPAVPASPQAVARIIATGDLYNRQHEAIRAAVPAMLSLLLGGVGGLLTAWISERSSGAAS
jgi:hypothetical protein